MQHSGIGFLFLAVLKIPMGSTSTLGILPFGSIHPEHILEITGLAYPQRILFEALLSNR